MTGEPCNRCDTVHNPRRCSGHVHTVKGDRGSPLRQCGNAPLTGLKVCRYHGGAAPHARAAGIRRAEQAAFDAAANAAVTTLGLPVDIEPHQALIDELCRTQGHVVWLATRIAAADLTGSGLGDLEEQVAEGANQPSVLLRTYQAERAHLTRVAVECIKAGVEERRVRAIEAEAGQVQAYTRALLVAMGWDLADPKVRFAIETAARELDPTRPR